MKKKLLKQKTINMKVLKLLYKMRKTKMKALKKLILKKNIDNDQNKNNYHVKLLKGFILHIYDISFPNINKEKTYFASS